MAFSLVCLSTASLYGTCWQDLCECSFLTLLCAAQHHLLCLQEYLLERQFNELSMGVKDRNSIANDLVFQADLLNIAYWSSLLYSVFIIHVSQQHHRDKAQCHYSKMCGY